MLKITVSWSRERSKRKRMNKMKIITSEQTTIFFGQSECFESGLFFYSAQVRDAAQAVDAGLVAMACGSYRRGKATCGDVDVLISHPDGKSHRGVFSKVLQLLHDSGKLLFFLFNEMFLDFFYKS